MGTEGWDEGKDGEMKIVKEAKGEITGSSAAKWEGTVCAVW